MKNGRVMLTDDKDKPSTLAKDAQQVAQWRPLILVVLLLALVLRLTAAVVVERRVQQAGRTFFIEGDANGYWHLGMAIANGDDYSVHTPNRRILRVPGFPLLLAGTICLFGDSVFRSSLCTGNGGSWLLLAHVATGQPFSEASCRILGGITNGCASAADWQQRLDSVGKLVHRFGCLLVCWHSSNLSMVREGCRMRMRNWIEKC